MKCINCETEWNAKEEIAKSIIKCPFCGENPLEKKSEPKFYETTKEALAAIYKQFGADVLLGKLNAYLPDLAPSISGNDKGLVYMVYEKGAAKALKENINGSKENMESAVKVAVRNLTEAYINQDIAEKIVYEFTDALGWKIGKPAAKESDGAADDENKKSKPQGMPTPAEPQPAPETPGKKTKPIAEEYIAKKFEKLKKNAQKGDAEAKEKTFECYLKSAQQGDVNAQMTVGMCYYNGDGVKNDYFKAIEWFDKAEIQGKNGKGWINKITDDMDNLIREKKYNKAIPVITAIAELGYSDAQRILGMCYNRGNGVPRDYAKAAQWYLKAAQQGDKRARKWYYELKKQG